MRRRSYGIVTEKYRQPGAAYARTQGWTTRYYNRKIGGTLVYDVGGINNTDDDIHKKQGEIPYSINRRIDGSRENRQRANNSSRPGQKLLKTLNEQWVTVRDEAETHLQVSEQHHILFPIEHTGKVIGIRLKLRTKPTTSSAYFVAILRDQNMNELCRAIHPVRSIKENYTNWEPRFIRSTKKGFIELALVDDIKGTDPLNTVVEIQASGQGSHKSADFPLPNINQKLREVEPKWEMDVAIPNHALLTTTSSTFPVWLQNGYFTKGTERYVLAGIDGAVYMYKYLTYDKDTKKQKTVESELWLLIRADQLQGAKTFRATQAGDRLYFVDGVHPLRYVKLSDFSVHDAVPQANAVVGWTTGIQYYKGMIVSKDGHLYKAKSDHTSAQWDPSLWEQAPISTISAKTGASLVYFLNNFIAVAGFPDDPNKVQFSSIDSKMQPNYDMFVDSMQCPDQSSATSASRPITAISDLQDQWVIFRTDGLSYINRPAGMEYADVSQTTPEGAVTGVLRQEHVVRGKNVIYWFNPSAGVMRLGGSVSTVVSKPIDATIRNISNTDEVYLGIHNDELRVYYTEIIDGMKKHRCLFNYSDRPMQRSYWLIDDNTPIVSYFSDSAYDVQLGVHAEFPAVVKIEDEGTLRDFDCAIEWELHTKYMTAPDRADEIIGRRTHVETLQNFNSSIFIGIDYDNKEDPMVWRRFIETNKDVPSPKVGVFGDNEPAGATMINIRHLTNKCRMLQVRLKQYCYDYRAEILSIAVEYGTSNKL